MRENLTAELKNIALYNLITSSTLVHTKNIWTTKSLSVFVCLSYFCTLNAFCMFLGSPLWLVLHCIHLMNMTMCFKQHYNHVMFWVVQVRYGNYIILLCLGRHFEIFCIMSTSLSLSSIPLLRHQWFWYNSIILIKLE